NVRWVSNSAIWCHGRRAVLSTSTGNNASIAYTRPVQIILGRTRSPTLYTEIRNAVLTEIESATTSKFDRCFNELRRLGFIYSELTPPITNKADPLSWVMDHLPTNPAGTRERFVLDVLRSQLRQCDEGLFTDRHIRVQNIADRVNEIKKHERPVPIQVDL